MIYDDYFSNRRVIYKKNKYICQIKNQKVQVKIDLMDDCI